MPLRKVQVILKEPAFETLHDLIKNFEVDLRFWTTKTNEHGFLEAVILIHSDYAQNFIESIEKHVNKADLYQIIVNSVEATIPKIEDPAETKDKSKKKKAGLIKSISYDELYVSVENQAKLTINFILLVILSTIVAVIGIVSDDMPTLIGAMLIAPLLGPNLALALSTIMFDLKLMRTALITNGIGIVISFILAFVVGVILNYTSHIHFGGYLIDHVTYSSIILAIASGAAAALYLLSGTMGALVGVMIATALLPPIAVMGIALSVGQYFDTLSAFLLLIVNIVCISLSANLMFLLKGVKPQSGYKKEKAKYANIIFVITMLILLAILFTAVYFLLKVHR